MDNLRFVSNVIVFAMMLGFSTSTHVDLRTFSLAASPKHGVTRLANSWTSSSPISCASSCLDLFHDNCLSFMYNAHTRLCTPGSVVNATTTLPSPAEGDLYHSFHCNISAGFSIVTVNDVDACVGKFEPQKDYYQADEECRKMGAVLVSVKTMDKLMIVRGDSWEDTVWVGCDDTASEGIYVWKEDGSNFTMANVPESFANGGPSGYTEDADCIYFHPFMSWLADRTCTVASKYICEILLP